MQNSPLILTFSRQGSNHSMDSRQEHAGMTTELLTLNVEL